MGQATVLHTTNVISFVKRFSALHSLSHSLPCFLLLLFMSVSMWCCWCVARSRLCTGLKCSLILSVCVSPSSALVMNILLPFRQFARQIQKSQETTTATAASEAAASVRPCAAHRRQMRSPSIHLSSLSHHLASSLFLCIRQVFTWIPLVLLLLLLLPSHFLSSLSVRASLRRRPCVRASVVRASSQRVWAPGHG